MKIQIDTDKKVLRLESDVNLGEFIEKIKTLLPGEWKDYKLETNVEIQWANPIVIKDYTNPWVYPWRYYDVGNSSNPYQTTFTISNCNGAVSSNTAMLSHYTDHVYNVEC